MAPLDDPKSLDARRSHLEIAPKPKKPLTSQTRITLADQLRQTAKPYSVNQLAAASGVDRRALSRFLHEGRDVAISTADKLGHALGLHLAPKPRKAATNQTTTKAQSILLPPPEPDDDDIEIMERSGNNL